MFEVVFWGIEVGIQAPLDEIVEQVEALGMRPRLSIEAFDNAAQKFVLHVLCLANVVLESPHGVGRR